MRHCPRSFLAPVLLFSLAACSAGEPAPSTTESSEPAVATEVAGPIDFVATDFAFTGPPTLPSGWNTIRFVNDGKQVHFLTFWRMPADKTFDDYTAEVIPAFFGAFGAYAEGQITREELMASLGENLPEWFFEAANVGGPGLTAAGESTEVTVNLPPGNYVLECYVLTPEQLPHNAEGMMRPLIVTDDVSATTPPEADIEITLSNYDIDISEPITAGTHTFAVNVTDTPEGLLGHGLHLARLDDDDDIAELVAWSDWVDGLRDPAPGHFVGGLEPMPAGSTGYFTATLEPGRYAFVSKEYVPRGMIHEFRVEN